MRRTQATGFTLIELIVTVSVMAILASMALPAFNEMVQNNRRVGIINDFLSTLHIARSEAITRNREISVCRSNAARTACMTSAGPWDDGWLGFIDTDADYVIDGGEAILIAGDPLPANLSLSSSAFTFALRYTTNGRVRASDGSRQGSFMLCELGADDASNRVTVSLTGRPRAETPAAGGAECSGGGS